MKFGEQLLLAHLRHPCTLRYLAAVLPELNVRKTLRSLSDQGLVSVSTENQWQLFEREYPVMVRRRAGVRRPSLTRLHAQAGLSRWRLAAHERAGGRHP